MHKYGLVLLMFSNALNYVHKYLDLLDPPHKVLVLCIFLFSVILILDSLHLGFFVFWVFCFLIIFFFYIQLRCVWVCVCMSVSNQVHTTCGMFLHSFILCVLVFLKQQGQKVQYCMTRIHNIFVVCIINFFFCSAICASRFVYILFTTSWTLWRFTVHMMLTSCCW